jgi:hypothetical protein
MKKSPNLFIAGSAKCGTTTLYHYLKQHPEIYMSPQKETWFFCPSHVGVLGPKRMFYPNDWQRYLELFEPAETEKYRGEATPSYICFDETIERIKKYTEKPRFIFSIRNPADRLHSNFRMFKRLQKLDSYMYEKYFEIHFKKYLEKDISSNLIQGLYAQRLNQYIRAFGRENVHIMIFERWTKNPQEELNRCFEFLNIAPFHFNEELHHHLGVDDSEKLLNQSISFWQKIRVTPIGNFIRKYQLQKPFKNLLIKNRLAQSEQEEIRTRIVSFYQDDVAALKILLNDDLAEWDEDFGMSETPIKLSA